MTPTAAGRSSAAAAALPVAAVLGATTSIPGLASIVCLLPVQCSGSQICRSRCHLRLSALHERMKQSERV